MATQLPTDTKASDPRAILLSITELVNIPQQIILWLIDDMGILESIHDILLLQIEDIQTIHTLYE